MKKLVIIPGGFHPFHAGHKALYDAARSAFPSADVYIAATADTSARPFPFELKKKLARIAGVDGHRFIQVKSPFRAQEITQMYDPNETVLIFARSEKDREQQPQAGGVKKDGSASYLQPFKRNGLQPMSQHGYMVYLPTVQFGPGMTSATEIRAKWPGMEPEQKVRLVQQLYPDTVQKTKLADVIVKMFNEVMGGEEKPRAATEPEVKEAVLVNDPDAGHQIRPEGGMGTWDEKSMVSNLARKFADIANKLKASDYKSVYAALYQDRWIQNLAKALAEYQAFSAKQGRRPMARGREIEMSDYLDEKSMNEMQGPIAGIMYAKDLIDQVKSGEIKKYIEEERGPWYPKEFDIWQQDAVAYGFTIEKVPMPATGQATNSFYVKDRRGEIVGFWDGKSGNGVLTRTPGEYQAAISNQGMTAGGYAAYDKEVADNWTKIQPIMKKIRATKGA